MRGFPMTSSALQRKVVSQKQATTKPPVVAMDPLHRQAVLDCYDDIARDLDPALALRYGTVPWRDGDPGFIRAKARTEGPHAGARALLDRLMDLPSDGFDEFVQSLREVPYDHLVTQLLKTRERLKTAVERGEIRRRDLGQQPGKAEPKVVMCAEHADEKVNLYCKVDEMPICSLCKIAGKHQSHDVTALSDVYQEKRDILMEEVSAFKERNKEIGDFVAGMRETCAKVQDKRKEWQERLVRDTARLEKILQERKKFLAGALIQEEEEKLKLLKEEIAKKEGHLKKAQAVVAYADEVLKEKDQSCFLQAVKSTRERVEQGQNKDALVVPADLVFKGFDLSRQLEALEAIDQNELSTSWQECVDKLSTSSYLKTERGNRVLYRDGDKLVDGDPKTYWHSDNRKQTKNRLPDGK
ncbi:probable E3 ubiquitin-protein ligase MID2 [Branchiostoma lanceolatum]|uniref:probable E3 ubiquitin-protein ligase MID2 n=1 Tax=Branchiostoma lanceolatum TaxID=7740 RepID=UPI0034517124